MPPLLEKWGGGGGGGGGEGGWGGRLPPCPPPAPTPLHGMYTCDQGRIDPPKLAVI